MDAYRKAVGGGGKTQTASGKGTNSKSVNKGGASGFGNPRANVFGSTDAETPQEKAQKQNKKVARQRKLITKTTDDINRANAIFG